MNKSIVRHKIAITSLGEFLTYVKSTTIILHSPGCKKKVIIVIIITRAASIQNFAFDSRRFSKTYMGFDSVSIRFFCVSSHLFFNLFTQYFASIELLNSCKKCKSFEKLWQWCTDWYELVIIHQMVWVRKVTNLADKEIS